MTVVQAVVLGIVQGVTEFLPVSSKTHLVVVPALLGWPPPNLAFVVWLHLGTLVALVAYFLRDLVAMARSLGTRNSEGRRAVALLAAASVPAAVLGLLFEATFERLLSETRAVALSLLATAAILVACEWRAGTIGRRRLARPLRQRIELRDAVGMGLAQGVALLPGVSRSGSTMGAALALGVARPVAAQFSFLMAIAAIAGANILELPEVLSGGIGRAEAAGFAAAVVSGYLVVAGLLRFLRTRTFLAFSGYCVVFAVTAFLRLG